MVFVSAAYSIANVMHLSIVIKKILWPACYNAAQEFAAATDE